MKGPKQFLAWNDFLLYQNASIRPSASIYVLHCLISAENLTVHSVALLKSYSNLLWHLIPAMRLFKKQTTKKWVMKSASVFDLLVRSLLWCWTVMCLNICQYSCSLKSYATLHWFLHFIIFLSILKLLNTLQVCSSLSYILRSQHVLCISGIRPLLCSKLV